MKVEYIYNAKVVDVIDGDTIVCDMDLGFSFFARLTLRLYGINTPEIHGEQKEAGLKAKKFVQDTILGKAVTIQTFKNVKEKYGRYLAKVYYPIVEKPASDVCLNDVLTAKGLAKEYFGIGEKQ
jgi:micrococcal nuclease